MEPITFDWIVVAAIVATVAVLISAGTATFLRRPRRVRINKSARIWVPPTWLEEQTNRLNGVDTDEALLALDALESHAQNRPERRSEVAAILCEHLRRNSSRDEGRRTRAVQRVLTGHVRAARDEHWPDLDLDLDRTRLQDLDLSHADVRRLSLAGATLSGTTRLGGIRCRGSLNASGTLFDGPVEAEPLAIHGQTQLSGAAFTASCNFAGSVFYDAVELAGAVVSGPAWFTDAVFLGPVTLSTADDSASFAGPVDLQRVACDALRLDGDEFPGGLTIGRLDDAEPRAVTGHHPELANIVRSALHYAIGDTSSHLDDSSSEGRVAPPPSPRDPRGLRQG